MKKIAVIGQGYVGLPLAVALAYHHQVIGFDIDQERVEELNQGIDRTKEADPDKLHKVIHLYQQPGKQSGYKASSRLGDLQHAQIYIVTVPTPIDRYNAPDLVPLLKATEMLGNVLRQGDIVIYESTVYPGCTEEECVPVLERTSGLVYNKDFFIGYSPERINPGDKINTLTTIKKVTSGSTPAIAEEVDQLYKTIIQAGTHKAPSIKVAEAAKAIENAQRDVNISFVNELALIFDRIGIDTHDVLEAAGTKFNFLKYKPGLVGGHCISVDPYYLAQKASQLGYHPQVILSGRRVNDMMASFIAAKVVKLMIAKDIAIKGAKALVLGITFKENCPDVRNTKVVDIVRDLQAFGLNVDVYDPWANPDEVKREYGIACLSKLSDCQPTAVEGQTYDTIILAVAHQEFLQLDITRLRKDKAVVFDIKACLDRNLVDARL